MSERIPMTPAGYQKLLAEFKHHREVLRPQVVRDIEEAREHGDISENADYDAAKNEQGHNEARIRHLERMLRDAVVVEPAAGDTVEPGVVVEIRVDDDDQTESYVFGSIEERHPELDVLTPASPLGQAIAGRGPGDEVTYEGPRRPIRVEVVSVRPVD